MYGTAHAAVAASAVTLLKLSNPFAAFAVGWATHYVCDFFPHGDTVPGTLAPIVRKRWHERSVNAALIDIGLLLWLWHRRNQRRGHSWPFTLAAIGSIGPDALQLFGRAVGIRFLWGWPETVHHFFHNPFLIVLPLWLGWLLQLLMVVLVWRWLLKPLPDAKT